MCDEFLCVLFGCKCLCRGLKIYNTLDKEEYFIFYTRSFMWYFRLIYIKSAK